MGALSFVLVLIQEKSITILIEQKGISARVIPSLLSFS